MEPPPPIAISAIEHYEYCPRQCALIHGDGVWEDNSHTVRGGHGHKRVDTGSDKRERGKLVLRSLPLWSARLNLSGRADVVECHDDGSLVPIEYKIGTRHGMTADLQLCAQGLCLEEMTGQPVQQGYVWYSLARRRRRVQLNAELREFTEKVIEEIRVMLADRVLPVAVDDQRCGECQLFEHCVPALTSRKGNKRVARYIEKELYACGF